MSLRWIRGLMGVYIIRNEEEYQRLSELTKDLLASTQGDGIKVEFNDDNVEFCTFLIRRIGEEISEFLEVIEEMHEKELDEIESEKLTMFFAVKADYNFLMELPPLLRKEYNGFDGTYFLMLGIFISSFYQLVVEEDKDGSIILSYKLMEQLKEALEPDYPEDDYSEFDIAK